MTKRIIAVLVVLMMFTLMVGCSESGTTNSVASTDATSSAVSTQVPSSSKTSEPVEEQPVSDPGSVNVSESQLDDPIRPQTDKELQLLVDKPDGTMLFYNDGETVPVSEGDKYATSTAGIYKVRFELNGQEITRDDEVTEFMADGENTLVMYTQYGEFLDEYSHTYKLVRAD
ncbi:MAG: hypothetical protein ACLUD1_09335 [Clostridia bacterium]